MFTLTIPGRLNSDQAANVADASAAYLNRQTASQEGASTFPEGQLYDDGELVGRLSYNGRVWAIATAIHPLTLVYCPASADEDEGRPDIFNEGRESVWGRKVPNPYLADTLKHRVFERGAAAAKRCRA